MENILDVFSLNIKKKVKLKSFMVHLLIRFILVDMWSLMMGEIITRMKMKIEWLLHILKIQSLMITINQYNPIQ